MFPAFKPLPKVFLSIAFSLFLAPHAALRFFSAWRRRNAHRSAHRVVKINLRRKRYWLRFWNQALTLEQ